MAAKQSEMRSNSNHYRNHPQINKGLKFVIFPTNTKILWWDFLMILVVFYYAFSIPYHFGIGGGYAVITNIKFFVFQLCLDGLFISECIHALYIGERNMFLYSL